MANTKAGDIQKIVDDYVTGVGGVESAGVFTMQGLEIYINPQASAATFAAYLATLFGATENAIANLGSKKATMSITECDGTSAENKKYCIIVPVTDSVLFGSLVSNCAFGIYLPESRKAAGKIAEILNG